MMFPDEAQRLADALRLMVAHEARIITGQTAGGQCCIWVLWPAGPVLLATVGECFAAMRQLCGVWPWAIEQEG